MNKKVLLLAIMSVVALNVTADVKISEATFPDSNFRKWVLSQEYGADGVLTNEELDSVTSLNLSRLDIHNQKGIEYFTALKDLNCMTNKLTTLNLSKNTALEKLECRGNRLTTINLLENRKLRSLKCGGNQLTSLDVSNCTELDTLACSGNPLKILDVSKNTKLTYLGCYSNQLTALDLSKNTVLNFLQCNNNQLTVLDVSKNTALTFLQCSSNLLTSLDVTKNSALTYLSCMNNKLTTLYVSNNKSLEYITCSSNQLTSLDVSGCSALKSLGCSGNQLTTLDLSGCSELEGVTSSYNQLTTLNLSENTALTMLSCYKNQIKGIGMDALLESLPTVSDGRLNVMYFENEQNVMTTTQVAAAKAKGWISYYWYEAAMGWIEYAGSETAQDAQETQMAYRPLVEEGKVWKLGTVDSGNPVQWVEYYYFDGDTIIGGKTCKQMMCQRYINQEFAESNSISQSHSSSYVGAWYEEDKKVYFCDPTNNQFKLKYDFSIDANDTLQIDYFSYVIGPRKTGGISGFKGVYRDVWKCGDDERNYRCAPWLEGVGGVYAPPTTNVFNVEMVDPSGFLMSCTVGDEVIYFNDEYEDGATPDAARKQRIDFTHTVKIKPQSRTTREADASLYGEYNEQQLGINLNTLDDAYQVSITDEAGKAVYEKTVNAGNIVGLNINISDYAEGRYTVTVENSNESFTAQFDTQTTSILEVKGNRLEVRDGIYNLQGQRISSLRKGLNIVNGRKVYVK